MIYYITPYLTGDIGKAINEAIAVLPEDSWVCLRDTDTMFLLPDQPSMLEALVNSNPLFDVIGASCNRLGSGYQLYGEVINDDPNILNHIEYAKKAREKYKNNIEVVPTDKPLAGFFLLFRKSLWNEIPFEERTIQFDLIFSRTLHEKGKRLGLMRGMYLFHIYRLGYDRPQRAVSHLMHCHDHSKTI